MTSHVLIPLSIELDISTTSSNIVIVYTKYQENGQSRCVSLIVIAGNWDIIPHVELGRNTSLSPSRLTILFGLVLTLEQLQFFEETQTSRVQSPSLRTLKIAQSRSAMT